MPTNTWTVGASSDDCRVRVDDSAGLPYVWTNIDLTQTDHPAGHHAAWTDYLGAGARFTGINIPNGATIVSAYLKLDARSDESATPVNTRIYGEDADNAVTFTNVVNYNERARTTAQVDWDAIPAWTADVTYTSPNIGTIIKEIVDRGAWSSGNAIVIFWEDHGSVSAYRKGASINDGVKDPPKLEITWLAGWNGEISGVVNPSEIAGVAAENIAAIKGVAG